MNLENLKVVELEAQEVKSVEGGGLLSGICTFICWNHRINMQILNGIAAIGIANSQVHNHPLNN
jgi:hypothetical protein